MDEPFLTALSSTEPIPGGGAASAYGACVGLALLEKIVRLELRRHQIPPDLASLWSDLLEHVSLATKNLRGLRDEDGRAYMRFAGAKTSGKGEETVTEALESAIKCPLEIMEKACQALHLVSEAGKHCKRHLLPDLLVCAQLLMAAVQGASQIARANLRLMSNLSLKVDFQKRLDELRSHCHESFGVVEMELAARSSGANGAL